MVSENTKTATMPFGSGMVQRNGKFTGSIWAYKKLIRNFMLLKESVFEDPLTSVRMNLEQMTRKKKQKKTMCQAI